MGRLGRLHLRLQPLQADALHGLFLGCLRQLVIMIGNCSLLDLQLLLLHLERVGLGGLLI